jgi:hypothetical protein
MAVATLIHEHNERKRHAQRGSTSYVGAMPSVIKKLATTDSTKTSYFQDANPTYSKHTFCTSVICQESFS